MKKGFLGGKKTQSAIMNLVARLRLTASDCAA